MRHCIRAAEVFPDEPILSALRRELSWTHLKMLMYVEDSLKRDFYIELCRLERWSSRQLQERMQSMLFERSALSRQPDEVMRREVAHLRDARQMTPDLVLKDPYIIDFLGISDHYLARDLEDAILREMEQFWNLVLALHSSCARSGCQSTMTTSISTYCSTTANSSVLSRSN
ncbi:uncharacterized protein BCN122_III0865 [Burkholderia cenocepacia]|nr:uncharacterized protein BCN122_III0865 [Burkholderia cenocepacia]SPV16269.1 DNA-binding protein HU-alpha [Burkholderia cenocepacia]